MANPVPLITQTPSPNFGERRGGVTADMLIIHFTDQPDVTAAVDILTDPARAVSAHYLIAADGQILQLVAEHKRAWHAGVAHWAGQTDINSRSIGIELDNPGIDTGRHPFPAVQMRALITLARAIIARHPIPARHVLGHSDIAPLRKQDPGPLFDWQHLAAAGIGLWPDATDQRDICAADAAMMLSEIGYDPAAIAASPTAVVSAFQSHWRPTKIDGQLDPETRNFIAAVADLVAADKAR